MERAVSRSGAKLDGVVTVWDALPHPLSECGGEVVVLPMGWIIELEKDTLGPVDYDEARKIVRANPTARVRGEGDAVWLMGTEALFSNQQAANDYVRRVTVTDIDMPFMSMVGFMVKWSLASIPAAIILLAIGAAIWRLLIAAVR